MAHPRMQRIERLHRVDAILREKALAERMHPEINHTMLQGRTAEPARKRCHAGTVSNKMTGLIRFSVKIPAGRLIVGRLGDEVATVGAMRFHETMLPGAMVVELEPHVDDRGAFARTVCVDEFAAVRSPDRVPAVQPLDERPSWDAARHALQCRTVRRVETGPLRARRGSRRHRRPPGGLRRRGSCTSAST